MLTEQNDDPFKTTTCIYHVYHAKLTQRRLNLLVQRWAIYICSTSKLYKYI